MKWFNERPTKPGVYWFKQLEDERKYSEYTGEISADDVSEVDGVVTITEYFDTPKYLFKHYK